MTDGDHDMTAGARRVQAVIDYSGSDVGDQIATFAQMLGADGEIVLLDLRIVASDDGNYRVAALRGDESRPLACDGPTRLEDDGYRFEFNPDYNHLLLTIRHGAWSRAPFATAACITNSQTGATDFVIRGPYWTSSLDIPTAVDVELRPITAPSTR